MTGPGRDGISQVREFKVPVPVLDRTLEVLADAGRKQLEAFVVWGGILYGDGAGLRFTSALVPEQKSMTTAHGLMVVVPGESLFVVNKALYERGEILAGQVHSHPTEAYHSDTDDHYPLVTLLGAISLVIPDFAKAGRTGRQRWAWYRLQGPGRWAPIDSHTRILLEPQ
jgi:hypothetical protein